MRRINRNWNKITNDDPVAICIPNTPYVLEQQGACALAAKGSLKTSSDAGLFVVQKIGHLVAAIVPLIPLHFGLDSISSTAEMLFILVCVIGYQACLYRYFSLMRKAQEASPSEVPALVRKSQIATFQAVACVLSLYLVPSLMRSPAPFEIQGPALYNGALVVASIGAYYLFMKNGVHRTEEHGEPNLYFAESGLGLGSSRTPYPFLNKELTAVVVTRNGFMIATQSEANFCIPYCVLTENDYNRFVDKLHAYEDRIVYHDAPDLSLLNYARRPMAAA